MLRKFNGLNNTLFWLCLILLGVFAIAYSNSLFVLGVIWSGVESAGYSHGFLVLACTIYLIYLKKEEFKIISPRPNFWGLLPLCSLSILWFLAMASAVQTVQLAVLPLLLLSSILLLLGHQFLKLAFIPVILLFFALPVWNLLLPLLQDITTQIAHLNLSLLGKPVFVEDNYIRLPGGSFLIEESCSGLRFLLVSTTLSLMYSSMNSLKLVQSILLLCISVILSFIANWVRVLVIVLIGDYTNMQSSLVHDHANLGWAIFLVLVLIPFFIISKYFTTHQLSPTQDSAQKVDVNLSTFYGAMFLACCALLTGPSFYKIYGEQQYVQSYDIQIPVAHASWSINTQDPVLSPFDWRPSFLGASDTLYTEYINNGSRSIELHIIYYAMQQQNAELINVENSLVDNEQWLIVRGTEDIIDVDLSNGESINLLTLEVQSKQGQHKKVWYWYSVGGHSTVYPHLAKLFQVTSLLQNRTNASLIALAVNCESNCKNNDELISIYLDAMYPAIIESI